MLGVVSLNLSNLSDKHIAASHTLMTTGMRHQSTGINRTEIGYAIARVTGSGVQIAQLTNQSVTTDTTGNSGLAFDGEGVGAASNIGKTRSNVESINWSIGFVLVSQLSCTNRTGVDGESCERTRYRRV